MAKAAVLDIHSNNEARQRLVARSLGANPRPSMASSSAGEVTKFLVDQKLLEIPQAQAARSEEHTSELQSLMRISYAVFCLKKKKYIRQPLYNYSNNEYPLYSNPTSKSHITTHTI